MHYTVRWDMLGYRGGGGKCGSTLDKIVTYVTLRGTYVHYNTTRYETSLN